MIQCGLPPDVEDVKLRSIAAIEIIDRRFQKEYGIG
jgi:hypothetical protein